MPRKIALWQWARWLRAEKIGSLVIHVIQMI